MAKFCDSCIKIRKTTQYKIYGNLCIECENEYFNEEEVNNQ